MKDKAVPRFWEVDAVRGVAIIMVALYHLIYDLDNFGGYGIESTSGFWGFFADVSAFMFVFLVGLSLTLSYSKTSAVTGESTFGKYALRGLKVFAYGMLITFVFWAANFGAVIIGILQLIGLSIVLAYPFLRFGIANLFAGLLVIALGAYIQAQSFVVAGTAGVLLAPLGVIPANLFMPDYRPLLPWFGVVLLGVFFGNVAYLRWRKKRPAGPAPSYTTPLNFLGRHTLFIYLVHQPIIISTLWALGIISF
ncbi:MAG: heparan-alpha-glucosaminide N-acetyltransferase [Rubrobacteraceae bacterium]